MSGALTFMATVGVGIFVSFCVALGYVWARVFMPRKWAPYILVGSILLWAWVIGNGLLAW